MSITFDLCKNITYERGISFKGIKYNTMIGNTDFPIGEKFPPEHNKEPNIYIGSIFLYIKNSICKKNRFSFT